MGYSYVDFSVEDQAGFIGLNCVNVHRRQCFSHYSRISLLLLFSLALRTTGAGEAGTNVLDLLDLLLRQHAYTRRKS